MWGRYRLVLPCGSGVSLRVAEVSSDPPLCFGASVDVERFRLKLPSLMLT